MRKREIARMTGISCDRNEIVPGLHTILLGSVPYVPGGQISHAAISTKKKRRGKIRM